MGHRQRHRQRWCACKPSLWAVTQQPCSQCCKTINYLWLAQAASSLPRPPALARGPPGGMGQLRPVSGSAPASGLPTAQYGARGQLPPGQPAALRPPMGQPVPPFPGQHGPPMQQPTGPPSSGQIPQRPLGFQGGPRGPPALAPPVANGHAEMRPPFGAVRAAHGAAPFPNAGPPMRPGLRPPPMPSGAPTSPPPTSIGAVNVATGLVEY